MEEKCNNKYEAAFKKELEWLEEDMKITKELLDQTDAGRAAGWNRQHLLERLGYTSNEKLRLSTWLEECEKENGDS